MEVLQMATDFATIFSFCALVLMKIFTGLSLFNGFLIIRYKTTAVRRRWFFLYFGLYIILTSAASGQKWRP